MPDHLDFVAYFARHSAHAMKMPVSDTIHLQTDVRKWWTNRGPFVHGKTKDVFERKTYRRLIQVFDSHPDTVKAWIKHVNESLPAGIDLKVDRWEWEPIGFGASLPQPDVGDKKTHVDLIKEQAAKYIKQFSNKK
eukprot:jgi/Hompol1/2049/HPOL_002850-RA